MIFVVFTAGWFPDARLFLDRWFATIHPFSGRTAALLSGFFLGGNQEKNGLDN